MLCSFFVVVAFCFFVLFYSSILHPPFFLSFFFSFSVFFSLSHLLNIRLVLITFHGFFVRPIRQFVDFLFHGTYKA